MKLIYYATSRKLSSAISRLSLKMNASIPVETNERIAIDPRETWLGELSTLRRCHRER